MAKTDENADICQTQHTIDFCTMGMIIVDEIHYQPPTPPVFDILGGAGTYAAIGARIVSPPPLSRTIGWIVDAGSDFPPELRETIVSWQTTCLLRETPDRATTRGWNGYGENEQRSFKYTTPKLRLDENSLNIELLQAKSFHLICSPLRCIELIERISARRQSLNVSLPNPCWIWEPVPDLCVPSELQNCLKALELVDILSPNNSELCGFFEEQAYHAGGDTDRASVERCVSRILDHGLGSEGRGSVVVRCGKEGCHVANRQGRKWVPAYHQDANRVLDPTGGGNAFLGAMSITIARQDENQRRSLEKVVEAAVAGNVSASFAIEQIGMPRASVDRDGHERWNGERVSSRMSSLNMRLT